MKSLPNWGYPFKSQIHPPAIAPVCLVFQCPKAVTSVPLQSHCSPVATATAPAILLPPLYVWPSLAGASGQGAPHHCWVETKCWIWPMGPVFSTCTLGSPVLAGNLVLTFTHQRHNTELEGSFCLTKDSSSWVLCFLSVFHTEIYMGIPIHLRLHTLVRNYLGFKGEFA